MIDWGATVANEVEGSVKTQILLASDQISQLLVVPIKTTCTEANLHSNQQAVALKDYRPGACRRENVRRSSRQYVYPTPFRKDFKYQCKDHDETSNGAKASDRAMNEIQGDGRNHKQEACHHGNDRIGDFHQRSVRI